MRTAAPPAHARSALLALFAFGLPPGSAGAWLLGIAMLVMVVRTALLPVAIHGVRLAHARARALPALTELGRGYEGTRDLDRLREMRSEQRCIHAEHGSHGGAWPRHCYSYRCSTRCTEWCLTWPRATRSTPSTWAWCPRRRRPR